MDLGIDWGNYKTKVMGPYGATEFYSDLGEFRERNLVSSFGHDDMVLEYQGKKYFAGSLARFESEFGGVIMGDSKAHEEAKLRALIAIHRYAGDNDYRIVVGQPIGKHSESEKQKIKSMLKGQHTLTINDKKKTFCVSRVEVAAEGAAAIWSNKKHGLVRILDCGSGTVNAATIVNMKYIDRDSFTLDFGANTGKTSDPGDIAEGIIRCLLKKWKRTDKILIAGGIAEELQPHIEKAFINAEILKPIISMNGQPKTLHPMYANAVAFYNIARYLYG